MKTKVVYVSGAHGVGKDTVILNLARRLERAGMSTWVFQEFPFPPDIEIGTMDFQLKYKKVMEIREEMIDLLVEKGYFDFIICNRHPIDVDVYTHNLTSTRMIDFDTSVRRPNSIRFLITCPSSVVIDRLRERLKEEDWREDWNELDTNYFCNIQNLFKVVNEGSYNGEEEFVMFFFEIENIGIVDKAVEQIMERIY